MRIGYIRIYACICRLDVYIRGFLRVFLVRVEYRLCVECCFRGIVGNRVDRYF